MHRHRRKRLLELIADRYGHSRKRFCDASGLSESRLAQLLSATYRDGQGFGEQAARVLEKRLGLSELYFDRFSNREIDLPYDLDAVAIPQVTLTLSAGTPHIDMQEVFPTPCALLFPQHWIETHDLLPEKLFAIAVTDASMSPLLQEGDVIVVDSNDTALQDNMVYLFNFHGKATIKRLAMDFGQWFMTSDNTSAKRSPRQQFDQPACIVIGRIILRVSARI
ncbi:MAG: S24 family peptidase [Herbaspirillum sp.]